MKQEKEKTQKKKENIFANFIYRPISERIALLIAKTQVTPNQVSFLSIVTSFISGVFFYLGEWKYLLFAFVFLQLTILLDHVDGNLARYTNRCTELGKWTDAISNILHKFFFLFGASVGVFRITNNPLYIILGFLALFNWNFSAFINATRYMLNFKKHPTLFKESKRYFPVSLIGYNIIGLSALLNKVGYMLWFFAIFGFFVWLKLIYNVFRQWKREKLGKTNI